MLNESLAMSQEENNSLRCQNEDLSFRLRKTEAILSRVKEELAQYRAANGRNLHIDFDEEQQLDKKLKVSNLDYYKTKVYSCKASKHAHTHTHTLGPSNGGIYLKQETEEERLQLAQKLLGLCTTVLKVSPAFCLYILKIFPLPVKADLVTVIYYWYEENQNQFHYLMFGNNRPLE